MAPDYSSVVYRGKMLQKMRQQMLKKKLEMKMCQLKDSEGEQKTNKHDTEKSTVWSEICIHGCVGSAWLRVKKQAFALKLFRKLLIPHIIRWRQRFQRRKLLESAQQSVPLPRVSDPVFKIPFFIQWPESVVQHLLRTMERVVVLAGSFLIIENECCSDVYFIAAGEAHVLAASRGCGKPQHVSTLTSGFIGHLSALCGGIRTASVRCETNCVLWMVKGEVYEECLRMLSKEALQSLTLIAHTSRQTNLEGNHRIVASDLLEGTPPIFKGVIPESVLTPLAAEFKPQVVYAGDTVVSKLSPVRSLMILLKGQICAQDVAPEFKSEDSPSGELGPGSFIGIELLSVCRCHTRTYKAVGHCDFSAISAETLTNFLRAPSTISLATVYYSLRERVNQIVHSWISPLTATKLSTASPILQPVNYRAWMGISSKVSQQIIGTGTCLAKRGSHTDVMTILVAGTLVGYSDNNDVVNIYEPFCVVNASQVILGSPAAFDVEVKSRYAVVVHLPKSWLKTKSTKASAMSEIYDLASREFESIHGIGSATRYRGGSMLYHKPDLQDKLTRAVQLQKEPTEAPRRHRMTDPNPLKKLKSPRGLAEKRRREQHARDGEIAKRILREDLVIARDMIAREEPRRKLTVYEHSEIDDMIPFKTRRVAPIVTTSQPPADDESLAPPVETLTGREFQSLLGVDAVNFGDPDFQGWVSERRNDIDEDLLNEDAASESIVFINSHHVESPTPLISSRGSSHISNPHRSSSTEKVSFPMLAAVFDRQAAEEANRNRRKVMPYPPVRPPPVTKAVTRDSELWKLMTCANPSKRRYNQISVKISPQPPPILAAAPAAEQSRSLPVLMEGQPGKRRGPRRFPSSRLNK